MPAAFAHLQHAAGNAAVAALVARAGVPVGQAAPGGLSAVQSRSAGAAGWTGIQHSAAFTNIDLTTSIDPASRPGAAFVVVDPPADSPDAVHEALYLLPGDHRSSPRTYRDRGRTFTPYTRVSAAMSERIRQGEQEHLDDARRAYDLTYGLVLAGIRSLSGRRFGPAATPVAAEARARAAFEALMPAPMTTRRPGYRGAWVQLLDTLLSQSMARDRAQWHDLSTGPSVTEGDRWVSTLAETPTTRIGQVGSDAVVNYPAAP